MPGTPLKKKKKVCKTPIIYQSLSSAFRNLIQSLQYSCEVDDIIFYLQMKKLRPRNINTLSQAHTASK